MNHCQLHVHSVYSPMRGLSSLESLCEKAFKLGHDHLALTDTNGLYGIPHFVNLAREYGLIPIIGCELVLEDLRLVILCRNLDGFKQLTRLLTKYHQHGLGRVACLKFVKEMSENVIVFTDDKEALLFLQKIFKKEVLFFEVTKGMTTHRDILWFKEQQIKPLATSRVHMPKKGEDFYYRLLRAIDENSTLEEIDTSGEHSSYCYFPTNSEFKKWFELIPEALESTLTVARLCRSDWFGNKLIFPSFKGMTLEEASLALRQKCLDQLDWRYGEVDCETLEKVQERLSYELSIIEGKGFSNYFLVVDEFVSQSGINCGRGSGAASIVCYLLGITHVDPIKHNLFFERFLNEFRVDPPDIDVDFPWDERDDILDYVFEKYAGRAAMVANHNFLRDRSAIREVAKVYGIKEDEISYITNRLPRVEIDSTWRQIITHALKIEGCLRHLSVHCGGVVVTPGPIEDYAPVEWAAKGVPVIQWEKDQTEIAGLVKIDLLGNRSLAVVRDALNMANRNYQKNYDYRLFNPVDDPKTKEMMKLGTTMGVFYVESPGTRLYLQKQRSGEFEHNTIAGSVIRPAARRFANIIAERINGKPFEHFHPILKPILDETFGVLIYQEQVTQVAMVMADFDVIEGNDLRKVLGKKHKEKKLKDYKDKFFQGAFDKGIDKKVVDDVWAMILSFAGYSFCKPHSASYCLVSYKAAYLKTHYPAEFMAAVISNQGGFYNSTAYLEEARRFGVEILPPDINHSENHYVGFKNYIRTGLMQVKGIRTKTIEKIIFERRENGLFLDVADFLKRVEPTFEEARTLAKARAYTSLRGENKETALVELMWEVYFHFAEKKGFLQHLPESDHQLEKVKPKMREYDSLQLVDWEFEHMGGFVSFSSWQLYRHILERDDVVRGIDFPVLKDKHVRLFGDFITSKATRTKKGDTMLFVSFSDDSAVYETVFFPEAYYAFRDLLFLGGAFLVEGQVQEDFGSFVLQVTNLQRFAQNWA
ncbi:MAG: DNA polymerase III subunit alpha [Bacteriovoracaceae bacterium]|nr:DNA polymerase III subunit alpha [Bacteriovoracaceae bacterium]